MENQYRGKRTEKDGRSGGAEQQEARCAEITPAPVWNGATRTGSRTAADGKTAPIKKAPPCGGKAFLNEKKTAGEPADRASGGPWNTGG